jgi:hypothetical protein
LWVSLQGVGYPVLLPGAELERYLGAVACRVLPELRHPAGERPLYTSATFFAPPSAAELSKIGSDDFTEPAPRPALEQARGVAVSNKIMLLGEDVLLARICTGTLARPALEDRARVACSEPGP